MALSQTDDGSGRIFTVSQLTKEIKSLIEDRFPFVWLEGEISNYRMPASGHAYFTLKDDNAQISGVMFRAQNESLPFRLENGITVMGFGRVSVYEPRGSYQIIFEYLEPKGAGALQLAFEQLKQKLSDEGMFDADQKLPLPFIPRQICLITSLSGAALQDMLNILRRRFVGIPVEILPVKVQGDGSAEEIVTAIALLNARKTSDVAILARGGGSIEDLQAFNSENVARAIFDSKIPIVSGVGHETDYTIADFVADLRAPTPSAAAELVVPERSELIKKIKENQLYTFKRLLRILAEFREKRLSLTNRLKHPRKRLEESWQKTDDLQQRLIRRISQQIRDSHQQMALFQQMLVQFGGRKKIVLYKALLDKYTNNLLNNLDKLLTNNSHALREQIVRLNTLNPMNILARGYSITRALPDRQIVLDAGATVIDQHLEIILWRGKLDVQVKKKTH